MNREVPSRVSECSNEVKPAGHALRGLNGGHGAAWIDAGRSRVVRSLVYSRTPQRRAAVRAMPPYSTPCTPVSAGQRPRAAGAVRRPGSRRRTHCGTRCRPASTATGHGPRHLDYRRATVTGCRVTAPCSPGYRWATWKTSRMTWSLPEPMLTVVAESPALLTGGRRSRNCRQGFLPDSLALRMALEGARSGTPGA